MNQPPDQVPGSIPGARLSDYTTFRLGGPCRALITCATPEALKDQVSKLHAAKEPFLLLGSGSNVVVADEGLNMVVLRYVSPTPIITLDENNQITVSGSTILDDLVLHSLEAGLEGLIFASGIPGTVGGAVVGNAGAWGQQVGDRLLSATILNAQGEMRKVDQAHFGFTYRNSRLKDNGEILLAATFQCRKGDPAMLARERADILRQREEKHPDLTINPCAGSFFRNIEPTSKAEKRQASGWFLEQAGGKSLIVGGARIFSKHANIIIKGPGCSAQDVYSIHLQMKAIVKEKFGLELEREVRFAGMIPGASESNPEGFW